MGEARTYQGEIVAWDPAKRFGFIRPRGSRQEDLVFLARRELMNRRREPGVGDIVVYGIELIAEERGKRLRTRQRATHVVYLGEEPRAEVAAGWSEKLALLGGVHLVVMVVLSCFMAPARWALVASALLSVLAYALYGYDKRAAGRGADRVPEATLQTFALLGGWPGAALAQSRLRHKSRKASFQTGFAIRLVLNLVGTYGALAWLYAEGV